MLTRSQSLDLQLMFDPEIERTLRRLRAEARRAVMAEERRDNEQPVAPADNRILLDYLAPPNQIVRSAIRVPTIEANNFEMRVPLIQMMQSIQFGGRVGEDPHNHVRKFLQLANTIKMNDISTDTIWLILFLFSVTDRVMNWMNNSLPEGSITTWDQLQRQFLAHYFPPALASKLLSEIAYFSQYEHETFYDAWDRFQDLLL